MQHQTYIPSYKTDKTVRDLFQGIPISEIISPSVEAGLDMIPSCLAFSTIELELGCFCPNPPKCILSNVKNINTVV